MNTPTKAITRDKSELRVLAALALLVVALAALTNAGNGSSFNRFFGKLNPLAVVFLVLGLGLTALHLLRFRAGFAICKKNNLRGVLIASSLSLPFAVVMILVDRQGVFPAGINVPFPGSLTFYPLMAYVAETVFQLVPLCLLVLVLPAVARPSRRETIIWASILAVSFVEPVYQARFMIGDSPTWAIVYVGVHIYLINLIQLSLYKRYDFLSACAFRLTYYALWHVLWGHLRLSLLF